VLVIDYPTQLFSKLSSARGPHLTRHCCSWIQTTYHFTKYWSIFIFLLASWHRKIISSKGCGNWSKQLHIYICVIIWLGVQMAWRKWKVQFELLLLIYTQSLSLSQVCTNPSPLSLHCAVVLWLCDGIAPNLPIVDKFVFYDNCLISHALIGSFLSSIRVQTDKILIYASSTFSCQTVNFLTNEILWTFLSSQSKSEKSYWQCLHHFE